MNGSNLIINAGALAYQDNSGLNNNSELSLAVNVEGL